MKASHSNEKKEFLYGNTPVEQALIANRRHLIHLYLKESYKSKPESNFLQLAKKRRISISFCTPKKLGELAQNSPHQGIVLSCGKLPLYSLEDLIQIKTTNPMTLIALDQIEDPQNLGAIIRSAAFLGASGVIILKDHRAPLNALTSKASAGAMEIFPLVEIVNLAATMKLLKTKGFWVLGSSLDGVRFDQQQLDDKIVLIMGNEGKGLRQLTIQNCDFLVRIPGTSPVESLNVNAAASILIHHFTKT